MIKKEVFFEYFKTIVGSIFGMLVVLFILLAVVRHNVYEEQAKDAIQNDALEYYKIGLLIDKNKFLESEYPKNYKINLKLGTLYEIYKDFPSAEAEYRLAIDKAPYTEFLPKYKLACFYIKQDRLDEAQTIMDKIIERPDKKLIKFKADIYNKLGEKYYNAADYEEALEKYEKSLSYYQIIKSNQINNVKNSLASTYVYLAEKYVDEMQMQDAINALQIANSLVNAPILKYKLALLLAQSNPELSYKYLEEVFKQEPSIINFDFYYTFLLKMAEDADLRGYFSQAELYRYKAEKFQEYCKTNILSIEDIAINYADGEMTLNRWKKRYNINLQLQLKNRSRNDIESLYVTIVFKDGKEILSDYFNQIVTKDSLLKKGESTAIINIKTNKDLIGRDEARQNIIAEIYVSKLESSYKLYLGTIPINEVSRMKKHKINWNDVFRQWMQKLHLQN